jgi:hypothetical protein
MGRAKNRIRSLVCHLVIPVAQLMLSQPYELKHLSDRGTEKWLSPAGLSAHLFYFEKRVF